MKVISVGPLARIAATVISLSWEQYKLIDYREEGGEWGFNKTWLSLKIFDKNKYVFNKVYKWYFPELGPTGTSWS